MSVFSGIARVTRWIAAGTPDRIQSLRSLYRRILCWNWGFSAGPQIQWATQELSQSCWRHNQVISMMWGLFFWFLTKCWGSCWRFSCLSGGLFAKTTVYCNDIYLLRGYTICSFIIRQRNHCFPWFCRGGKGHTDWVQSGIVICLGRNELRACSSVPLIILAQNFRWLCMSQTHIISVYKNVFTWFIYAGDCFSKFFKVETIAR